MTDSRKKVERAEAVKRLKAWKPIVIDRESLFDSMNDLLGCIYAGATSSWTLYLMMVRERLVWLLEGDDDDE